MPRDQPVCIESSSGNVFADLQFPDATDLDVCVRLAVAINRLIAARKLSERSVAKLLGIDRASAQALKRYELQRLSLGELLGHLTALGCGVETRIGKR